MPLWLMWTGGDQTLDEKENGGFHIANVVSIFMLIIFFVRSFCYALRGKRFDAPLGKGSEIHAAMAKRISTSLNLR